MRATVPVAALACLFLAMPVFAQTPPPPPPPYGQPAVTTPAAESSYDVNEWLVSGFVGGNFAHSSFNTTVDFGGNLAYLYQGAFGVEFNATFSPNFQLAELGGTQTDLNNYMVNGIAAIPVGALHSFQPFISAGVGAMTLGSSSNTITGITSPSETHLAGDVGAGIMAFHGAWGVRADVRYLAALGTKTTGPALLNNTDFWRANVGIAYRW